MKDRVETWQEMLGALRDAMNNLCNQHDKLTTKQLQHLLRAFRGVADAEMYLHKLIGEMDD